MEALTGSVVAYPLVKYIGLYRIPSGLGSYRHLAVDRELADGGTAGRPAVDTGEMWTTFPSRTMSTCFALFTSMCAAGTGSAAWV